MEVQAIGRKGRGIQAKGRNGGGRNTSKREGKGEEYKQKGGKGERGTSKIRKKTERLERLCLLYYFTCRKRFRQIFFIESYNERMTNGREDNT